MYVVKYKIKQGDKMINTIFEEYKTVPDLIKGICEFKNKCILNSIESSCITVFHTIYTQRESIFCDDILALCNKFQILFQTNLKTLDASILTIDKKILDITKWYSSLKLDANGLRKNLDRIKKLEYEQEALKTQKLDYINLQKEFLNMEKNE